jgi:Oxidoreductase family, NAD-binding Rossmann fold
MSSIHNFFSGVPKMKKPPKTSSPVRFGILSAANINPMALLYPVQTHPNAVVVSIAARDISKAKAQAAEFSVPEAYGSYQELLDKSDVDAVFIPLPNGLHTEWAIKSMKAGKHVLIEKPIASNADEVRQIQSCAKETGKIALEAFHWQFHPAAHVVKTIIDSGRYGNIVLTKVNMIIPDGTLPKDGIRFVYDKLAGGASMDLIYGYSATRFFTSAAGAQRSPPCVVLNAKARRFAGDRQIDEAMDSTLLLPTPEGKPDIRSSIHVDMCNPKWGRIIPRFWDMPTIFIELQKATITFNKYVHPAVIKFQKLQPALTGQTSIQLCRTTLLPLDRNPQQRDRNLAHAETLQLRSQMGCSLRTMVEHLSVSAGGICCKHSR